MSVHPSIYLSTPRGTLARSSWGVPQPGSAGGYPTSGTPIRPGGGTLTGGTPPQVPPSQTWLGGTPMGVPHLGYPIGPGRGTPPWVPPSDLAGGTPTGLYPTSVPPIRPGQGGTPMGRGYPDGYPTLSTPYQTWLGVLQQGGTPP